jgi:hypothetical protein
VGARPAVGIATGAAPDVVFQAVNASVQRHETTYYPRSILRMTATTKQPFGRGLYLALKGTDLLLYSDAGKELVAYPPDTQVFRNAAGAVTYLRMNGSGEPRQLGGR